MLTMEIEMDDSTMQKAARTARPGALERTTGRDRQGWFAVLDEWGARGRSYREIADWLTGEHGLSDWWAQKLIVEYEEARGIRPAAVRRDGTFEVGASKMVALTEIVTAAPDGLLATSLGFDPAAAGLVDHELFESITDPAKRLLLTSWATAEAARAWRPTRPAAAGSLRHRRVRIIRDYGMFERREAPQYYAAVERPAARRAERKRTAAG
jgi:heme-degrading monooxygenase HmoA